MILEPKDREKDEKYEEFNSPINPEDRYLNKVYKSRVTGIK